MGLALLKCCHNPPVAPSEVLAQTSRNNLTCIGCGLPFTVLRRKRRCKCCYGNFCQNCLRTNDRPSGFACNVCNLLQADHPDRSELMKQRVRQLQHFLSMKHISTEACTEKEELVDLILMVHRIQNAPIMQQMAASPTVPTVISSDDEQESFRTSNDGIVVATEQKDVGHVPQLPKNFVDLDVHTLSVRQLKEALARNFVTYRGCCEKKELVERAERLQQEMRKNSGQAVKGVPEEILCKICMDAVVDCVLLECGHMLTCTACGKVLNECPVCRHYVVRVVHIFRS